MIEIPIGKAIVPVEAEISPEFGEEAKACRGCVFSNGNCNVLNYLPCWPDKRKDGKNVIFKLVDINSHYIDGTIRKPIRRENENN